jgi:energy-coupling factor transporter ATP-binding protein EcfA2
MVRGYAPHFQRARPAWVFLKVRLSGKNFQAWSDFELDIEGLTILTGPSDTGKSALFRALKGVLRNELPAEWVRDGQDEPMEVTVEAGGYRITASRSRKGSTRYEVTPGTTDPTDEFAKLAGDIPPVVKGLKYGEVTIGDHDVDPLFGRQNSAQFLIDPLMYKPTEVNAILGAFGGTERLEAGKKEANLRKTQRDAEARTLAVQIRDAEERRAILGPIFVGIQVISEELRVLERDVRGLESEAHWLGQASDYRQRIVPLRRIMDTLTVPDTSGLDQLHKLAAHAEQAAEAAAYARWLSKPMATIASVTEDWGWCRRTWGEIGALEGAVEAGRHVVATDGLRNSLADAERTYSEAARLWNSISRLEVLSALLGELKGSADRLAGVETELSAAQAELKKGLCPKCGRQLEHTCV